MTPIWNDDYAAAMREVYRDHPDDHDVAALFAEAIMNRTPWQLWDIKTGKPAEGADTRRGDRGARAKPCTARAACSIRACCTCMSISWRCRRILSALCAPRTRCARPCPMPATSCTCQLTSTCFAATTRMSCDWNGGRSRPTASTSTREGAKNFYSLYRCHNYHFKLYGAMFLGQYETGDQKRPRR